MFAYSLRQELRELLGTIALAEAATASDILKMPPDPDLVRRCEKAWVAVRGEADVPSRAAAVGSFIESTANGIELRKLSYIDFSKHTKALDTALRMIEVDGRAIAFEEFTAFFAAVSAAAAAPVSATPRLECDSVPADGVLGELLSTPGAAVRRVA